MIKCIIFDCDGTLVDSEFLANLALARLLEQYDVVLDPAELMSRFRGWKLAEILDTIQKEADISLPSNFVTAYRQLFSKLSREQLEPIEGVKQTLDQIQLPMCVASSGPMHKIEESLRLTELDHYFDDLLFSAYDINLWKPDPGLFLHAAQMMGAKPEECLVVEDSKVGVQAALRAGMQAVYFSKNPEPELVGAAYHIETMPQLLDLLV